MFSFRCKVCGVVADPLHEQLCSIHRKGKRKRVRRRKKAPMSSPDLDFLEIESQYGGYLGVRTHCFGRREK